MRISAGTYCNAGRHAVLRCLLLGAAFALVFSCASTARYERSGFLGYAAVSWYGPKFHGKLTASGERFNMYALTCAHKTLPFGTRLKLTNVKNNRSVVVLVNDRGPFVRGRDIDVSKAAAERLGIIGPGTGRVRVAALGRDMRYAKYIDGGRVESVSNNNGPFTIQVAAFGDKSNALHFKRGLKLNHKDVYVLEKWIDGQRYYRVRLGKFLNEIQARRYARRLADEGYSALIIPYEKQM